MKSRKARQDRGLRLLITSMTSRNEDALPEPTEPDPQPPDEIAAMVENVIHMGYPRGWWPAKLVELVEEAPTRLVFDDKYLQRHSHDELARAVQILTGYKGTSRGLPIGLRDRQAAQTLGVTLSTFRRRVKKKLIQVLINELRRIAEADAG